MVFRYDSLVPTARGVEIERTLNEVFRGRATTSALGLGSTSRWSIAREAFDQFKDPDQIREFMRWFSEREGVARAVLEIQGMLNMPEQLRRARHGLWAEALREVFDVPVSPRRDAPRPHDE
jgi:hypothetical protein